MGAGSAADTDPAHATASHAAKCAARAFAIVVPAWDPAASVQRRHHPRQTAGSR
jgi:hypothetical protein